MSLSVDNKADHLYIVMVIIYISPKSAVKRATSIAANLFHPSEKCSEVAQILDEGSARDDGGCH